MKRFCLCLIMAIVGSYSALNAQTFDATGGNQSYTVPGPGTLTITAKGADGASAAVAGGSGATVKADFPVLFADELIIVAGKSGIGNLNGNGFGGGGGGSAVILTRNGTSTLLIVAGAGGGSSTFNRTGKGGSSADGTASGGTTPTVLTVFRGGTGGGGFNANGESISVAGNILYSGGGAGTLSGGGSGGTSPLGTSGGFGFGGGGSGNNLTFSGGGGGGYGGGNGGYGSVGSTTVGGAGGTSFILTTGVAGTNITRTDGANGGGSGQDGSVILNFVCGVTAPDLATAPGDPRYPAGQTSVTGLYQNSGPVTFNYTNCPGGTVNWTGSNSSSGSSTNGSLSLPTTTLGTVTYSATCTAGSCTGTASTVSINTVQDNRCGPNNQNVSMCYYGLTICVPQSYVARYKSIGATVGACGSSPVRIGVEEEPIQAPFELSVKGYPNPTQGGLTVEVMSKVAGPMQMHVLDLTGRSVQQRTEQLLEGMNEVKFDLTSQPSGTYLIRAVDALQRQGVVRVSKQ